VVVLTSLSSFAVHADPVDAKHYATLRKSMATGIGLDAVKSNPTSYAGKVFEIRGTMSGVMKKAESGSIMLTSPKGSFVVEMDVLPKENPGFEMACLAQVAPTGELVMKAWTYDAELRRYEESVAPRPAPKPAPAKPAAAGKTPTTSPTASKPAAITGEQMVLAYRKAIKQFNRKLSDGQADTIARSILGFSHKYKVDARLVCAVILAESNFKISATSRCGAMGLGQLMPTTAAGLGVNNAYDPVENIYGSTRYIKSVLDRVSGNKRWNELTWNDLALGLAAYNAGPGAVRKYGGIPPYKETQGYVRKVTQIYKRLCGVS
jgi:hypothetical protein